MNDKLQAQVQARIEAFAADITALLQQAVAEAVGDALKGAPATARGSKKAAPAKKARASRSGGRKKGEKRAPKELEALTNRLLREVQKKPELRIEQLSERMGVPTKDLTLPMKKLIAAKQVKTKGQRRATRYSAR